MVCGIHIFSCMSGKTREKKNRYTLYNNNCDDDRREKNIRK